MGLERLYRGPLVTPDSHGRCGKCGGLAHDAATTPPNGSPMRPIKGAIPMASIGMVALASYDDPYLRVVSAELYSEALHELDLEDAQAARELESRATYAAGGT
jgi:hypothetical protein